MIAPLSNTSFKLDSASLAGFFGGEEAVSAMGSVHLYPGRKWMGWYNTPGSFTIAKRYGQIANSRFWDGIFPGPDTDPATFFGFDGQSGPEFFAIHSGTRKKETGYLSALLLKAVQREKARDVNYGEHTPRKTSPVHLTILDLSERKEKPTADTMATNPLPLIDSNVESQAVPRRTYCLRAWLEQIPGLFDLPANELEVPVQRKKVTAGRLFLACLPILTSVGACVICGVSHDWYCFAMILVGVLCNGLSCFILGSGELRWRKPRASAASPPGDGIMIGESEMIIIVGGENQIQFLTMGRFLLRYAGEPTYTAIGVCSLLLYIQFLVQLLLIPQGTLFGQIMFLSTLAVSWAYNCHLSSLEKQKRQVSRLLKELGGPTLNRFEAGTRTTMAVLASIILATRVDGSKDKICRDLLNKLIPNDTEIWEQWKKDIVETIAGGKAIQRPSDERIQSSSNPGLLRHLYGDAYSAAQIYGDYKDKYRT